MNNNHKFYIVTQSASETLSSTIFEDCFPPFVLKVLSLFTVILTRKGHCFSFYG